MIFVCMKMNRKRRIDAELLLNSFLRNDAHYLATSAAYGDRGLPALRQAMGLFLRRTELGFVWLAYVNQEPVAVCVVSYAISTSIGGIAAKLDDVYVVLHWQRKGIATRMLKELVKELKKSRIQRIDTAVHKQNHDAANFYKSLGFKALDEDRLALLL
jgi:GNAT superfamily N-acetyltransferase